MAAFVSGGALPPSVRGTKQQGMIHGCDWYRLRDTSIRTGILN
eukprot:COSAG01_NODE_399_length_17543_cov_15.077792_3_plen_43_part_00